MHDIMHYFETILIASMRVIVKEIVKDVGGGYNE